MIKLSELNGRLASLETTVDSIAAKVDALGDPAVPADAEATVDRLAAKLSAIDAKLPAAPPTP